MFSKRLGQLSMFAALVPLAALSAGWTAATTGAGFDPGGAVTLPGGEAMVTSAIEQPASLTEPAPAQGAHRGARTGAVAIAMADGSGIPMTALAAYQRAASVVTTADRACALDWTLVAAVGMVESDHGRLKSSRLDADGRATPPIYGPSLTSPAGDPAPDTDGGAVDKLTSGDRAVGPMQFVPATWPLVAVDGDGDGRRDPQDIDDAALAAAVYLCSGDDDVSTDKGKRAALGRYNHSKAYVATVLKIAKGYADSPYGSEDIALTAAPAHAEPSPSGSGTKGRSKDGADAGKKRPGATKPSSKPKPRPTSGAQPADKPDTDAPASPTPSATPTDDGSWATLSERHAICAAELSARFPDLAAGWDTNRAVEACSIRMIGKTVPQANAATPGVVTDISGYVRWLINTLP
ncbi:transglycosylase protein with SLT domain [Nocardioides albertanoniae]|uniref:Transglycosylase protein with SLT domain n=1 Tax=Nocardioides albertanoniae TaxID=1175486 RepID=A0A543AD56_9ACTN|nr:lytic transglycosylase domain-containing protein [Nocardioides albertanoniae]TQL70514.1 transglycosylase protein with SLT domain [Nocardioides albertanoniae]